MYNNYCTYPYDTNETKLNTQSQSLKIYKLYTLRAVKRHEQYRSRLKFVYVILLNLRDLRDLPISEGDIVGTKRCV